MAVAIFTGALLFLFCAYALAPVFGLDALYPAVFAPYGPLSWAMAGLVVLGAAYWAVRKIREPKDDGQ